jgi:hypothetical protein
LCLNFILCAVLAPINFITGRAFLILPLFLACSKKPKHDSGSVGGLKGASKIFECGYEIGSGGDRQFLRSIRGRLILARGGGAYQR